MCYKSLRQSPSITEGRHKESGPLEQRLTGPKIVCSGGRRREGHQLKWKLTDLVCEYTHERQILCKSVTHI